MEIAGAETGPLGTDGLVTTKGDPWLWRMRVLDATHYAASPGEVAWWATALGEADSGLAVLVDRVPSTAFEAVGWGELADAAASAALAGADPDLLADLERAQRRPLDVGGLRDSLEALAAHGEAATTSKPVQRDVRALLLEKLAVELAAAAGAAMDLAAQHRAPERVESGTGPL